MKKENSLLLEHNSVTKMAQDLVNSVNEGFTNPLEAFVAIKHMEETCKLANKQLKDQDLTEAETYGVEAKDLKIHGAQIQVRNGAGRWSFSHLPEITDLEERLKELKESHKGAYKMSLKGNQMVTEHGELIEPATYIEAGQVIAVKLNK